MDMGGRKKALKRMEVDVSGRWQFTDILFALVIRRKSTVKAPLPASQSAALGLSLAESSQENITIRLVFWWHARTQSSH